VIRGACAWREFREAWRVLCDVNFALHTDPLDPYFLSAKKLAPLPPLSVRKKDFSD
jgi:hypothetical protein